MSKRPPLCTTGKIALAGKRNRERQLLDREQREHYRRDLLSLVGKNSSLAVSSGSGQGTPSRDERYAARIASAEKACLSVARSAVVRKVFLMFPRKLYLMEMEERLIRLTWVRMMMITPMILLCREHLNPLVA